jgi:hypothetical protein
MTQTATLLLLFAGEPTKAERALLDDFERQRRVTLVAPAPTPRSPYQPYRTELVLDIEGRLDEARSLASSLDEERALALLAAIERDLVEHPELPQAAWLLAEHHRIAADVKHGDGPISPEAEALLESARVLEGQRAPAFGAPSEPPPPAASSVRLTVRDLDVRDTLELDGVSGGGERRIEPGVHHVRVLRDGELTYAGWARLGDSVEVVLGVRPIEPCSSEDLAGTRSLSGTVAAPHPVKCQSWFAARRRAGTLELAACAHGACSSFTTLVAHDRSAPSSVPAWAIAAAGLGTMAAGLITVWATGGFEPSSVPPGPPTFTFGGVQGRPR